MRASTSILKGVLMTPKWHSLKGYHQNHLEKNLLRGQKTGGGTAGVCSPWKRKTESSIKNPLIFLIASNDFPSQLPKCHCETLLEFAESAWYHASCVVNSKVVNANCVILLPPSHSEFLNCSSCLSNSSSLLTDPPSPPTVRKVLFFINCRFVCMSRKANMMACWGNYTVKFCCCLKSWH